MASRSTHVLSTKDAVAPSLEEVRLAGLLPTFGARQALTGRLLTALEDGLRRR